MDVFDVIVIGGGLLGCFTARNLARYQLKTALFEAREDLCTGISRANTAVVYSGADTKPGTMKSRMCVQASQNFASLCAELGVRYKPCGSLMVCFGQRGEEILRRKLAQGLANGVRGIRLLGREEVLAMEPHLDGTVRLGLYAPDAGTVIPWEFGLAAAENAVHNGVEIFLNTKVTGIARRTDGYEVHAAGKVFWTRGIVNCAGLQADKILEKVQKPSVRIFPDACDYLILDTKVGGYIRHVVFFEPEDKANRLTLVPTVDGNILIEGGKYSLTGDAFFQTTPASLKQMQTMIASFVPSLPMEHVIRSFGAVRPNPYYVQRDFQSGLYVPIEKEIHSFNILETAENPAFLSLLGIKTPGLTCADELGRYAAERMAAVLQSEVNREFCSHAAAHLRLHDLPLAERVRYIRSHPAYGQIVCRCRNISAGEIIDSLHWHPGAVTLDGVKRRTGAGTGRCQGSFCTLRIMEMLAREQAIPVHLVNKDGPDSYIVQNEKCSYDHEPGKS